MSTGEEPPTTTFADSLEYFQQAAQLRKSGKPSITDYLEIARCYLKLDDKDRAKSSLEVKEFIMNNISLFFIFNVNYGNAILFATGRVNSRS